jgi:hypothetical protein
VGFAGAVTFGVGVAVGAVAGVGAVVGVATVARGFGVATFFGVPEAVSSAGDGTADGDLTSCLTIALRADESRPTITPMVREAKRIRTSMRTARRMITTRCPLAGEARRTLSGQVR